MTPHEKRNTAIIAAIKRFTDERIAQGPEACRQHIAAMVEGFPDDIRELFLTERTDA